MATQICPNCKKDSFTWSIAEEVSPLTYWGCHLCHYGAYEDESFERKCSKCGEKNQSKLEDDDKEYWWCSSCDRIEPN